MDLKNLKRHLEARLRQSRSSEGIEPAIRAPISEDSIAVLPFECEREEADIEFLSDGIPENIIHTLSRIRALRVIPRTSAFRYKGRGLDPVKAGRELGVRLVLVGRVRERAGHVEITTELIDCIEEAQLWGEKYAR